MKDKDSKDKISELRRRAELAAVEKSLGVSVVSALSPEKVQQLIHELQVHQIELEMQNEELRLTQQELEVSRDKYSDLYDFAPVGYFTLDEKGVILEVNLTASALLGRIKAFLVGKPLASFVYEEDGNTLYFHFRQVLETQSNQTCEIRLTKKDGSQIQVRLDTLVLSSQDGSPSVFRTVVTDIASRKRAEESLHDSELRYRRLFETAQDGILILASDTGQILDVNPYLIDLLGYSHEEFLDKYLWEVSPFKDTALNKGVFVRLQQEGYVRYEDLPLETSDGRSIFVEFVSSSYSVHGMTFIQCNIRDITDRKKAEEMLRESEELHRLTISSISDSILITDDMGDFTYVCPNTHLIFGYSQEEIEALGNVSKLLGHEFREPFQHESRQEIHNIEGAIKDKFGKPHTLLVNIKRVDIKGGTVLYTCRDISDLKRAEESLRDATAFLNTLLDSIPAPVFYKDTDGRYIGFNKSYEEFYGKTQQDFVGKSVFDIAPRDLAEVYHAKDLELFHSPGVQVYDSQVKDARGAVHDVVFHKSTFSDPQGHVLGLIGVILDITDRKRAEEARSRFLDRQERLNQLYQALLAPAELMQKLKMITDGVVDIFGADFCRIWRISPGDLCERGCVHATVTEESHVCNYRDKCLQLLASSGRYTHTDGLTHRRVPFGVYKIGLVASGREHKFLTNDVVHDPRVHNHDWARELGLVSFAGYQLSPPGGETLGVLALFSKHVITQEEDAQLDNLSSTTAQVIHAAEAAERLNEKDKQYRTLFEESIDGVYSVLRDGEITDANPSFCELFGYTKQGMIGKDIRDLYLDPADRPRFQKEIEEKGFVKDYEVTFRKGDGTEVDCLISSSVHFDKHGSIIGYRGILRDRTARNELHRQLQQAQKMEAVGTLAGGIAHDFNNILQVVLGYSELVLAEEDLPDRLRDDLGKVLLAGRNGADLVKRLLTFSRKAEIEPLDIDLNQRIRQTQKFLQRTIPKMIDIELIPAEDLGVIHADPTQVDQVLMNLAVNARDAMPEGGKLVIETANVVIDEDYASSHLEAKPGSYVLLRVSDTGSGMDKKTLEHIFEPFYTTKGPGEGTGLGLAMVFGIIKQHHGFINCYSEVGHGTTFKIYLPAVIPETRSEEPLVTAMPQGGTETILLVDDEELIRDLGKRILIKAGYTVLTAGNGREALDLYRSNKENISLVILDLIMPEMGGKQCLEELLKIDPKARGLIASGFAVNGQTKEAMQIGARGFVDKPYNMKEMLQSVRDVLDSE